MEYSLCYSNFFFDDLAVVMAYLSQYSDSAPSRFKDHLFERIEKVKTMPEMYATYSFAPEYRHIVIDRYIVIYRVEKEGRKIYMYRLLHGAQDIQSYL